MNAEVIKGMNRSGVKAQVKSASSNEKYSHNREKGEPSVEPDILEMNEASVYLQRER